MKNVIQKGKGLDLGVEPPRIKICSVPTPHPGISPIKDKASKLVLLIIMFDYYATVFMLEFKAF